jgi:hypothetical protein
VEVSASSPEEFDMKKIIAFLLLLPALLLASGKADAGTGPVVDLKVGRKILRKIPLRNPHLSRLQRKYDSKYAIFILCVWRVDSKSKVVCGCWDDNTENGEMLAGLRRLVGSTITSVNVKKPAWDLDLTFSNGLVLRVFCASVNLVDMDDNYSVFLPEGIFTVSTRSKLLKEQRPPFGGRD